MLKRTSVFFLLAFSIAACCSTKNTTKEKNSDNQSYKSIAKEKYNENYIVKSNIDSTYFVVASTSKKTSQNINSPLKFFVYNNKTGQVIFEDNLINGKLEWINRNQIKITTEPEVISGIEEKNKSMTGYIYDVTKKRKLSKLDEF